jgi:hypothetical protein
MTPRTLETDYLVVGCGAAGMAFADSLVGETGASLVMVDRRSAPGGHWNDAYPFVRLHQPSLYYGVNSTPLGSDAVVPRGPEKGLYERTGGAEIRAYYARVMERLIGSGRVRFFPNCEYVGEHRFASRLSGEMFEVKVRRKLVDAHYLAPSIPALTPAPFAVGDGVSVIPVHRLVDVVDKPERYVIVGAARPPSTPASGSSGTALIRTTSSGSSRARLGCRTAAIPSPASSSAPCSKASRCKWKPPPTRPRWTISSIGWKRPRRCGVSTLTCDRRCTRAQRSAIGRSPCCGASRTSSAWATSSA